MHTVEHENPRRCWATSSPESGRDVQPGSHLRFCQYIVCCGPLWICSTRTVCAQSNSMPTVVGLLCRGGVYRSPLDLPEPTANQCLSASHARLEFVAHASGQTRLGWSVCAHGRQRQTNERSHSLMERLKFVAVLVHLPPKLSLNFLCGVRFVSSTFASS